jgi:hypothetical protein
MRYPWNLETMWYLYVRDERFPDSGLSARMHGMCGGVPPVEVAHHVHLLGIRPPHREIRSGLAVDGSQVRSQVLVKPHMASFVEQIQIVIAQQ